MKIAVLASGGVDSSVALTELARAGEHDVTAYYLKIWLEDELASLGNCPWEEDLAFVRAICGDLGVTLEIVPLQREYRDRVVAYTLEELRMGRTPSPDIFCNQRIKFGAFYEKFGSQFDRIATGHYARVDRSEDRVRLLKGNDPVKDQTYFLSHLTYEQLSRCEFPVGHRPKSEVREIADRYQLPNRNRRDSQGICFLGKIPFDEFVRFHLGDRPGAIVEQGTGAILGEHRGYWYHTIGQRRGLGLSRGPWFVVEKDVESNVIFVAHGDRVAGHERRHFEIAATHWIDPDHPLALQPSSEKLTVKIRHSPTVYGARLEPLERAGAFRVELDEPDPGVASGQFAILYAGDHCLGGAVITR